MIASSTSNQKQATATFNLGNVIFDSSENDLVLFKVNTPSHCVNHGFWLLENLLLHKWAEISWKRTEDAEMLSKELLQIIWQQTFHNLLNFHLEGDDLPCSRSIHASFNSMNWKDCKGMLSIWKAASNVQKMIKSGVELTSVFDGSDIIIFQKYHPIGVFDDGTETAKYSLQYILWHLRCYQKVLGTIFRKRRNRNQSFNYNTTWILLQNTVAQRPDAIPISCIGSNWNNPSRWLRLASRMGQEEAPPHSDSILIKITLKLM